MPHTTLQLLLENDESIVRSYQASIRIWENIWNNPESNTVEGLAQLLTDEQFTFENECGYRHTGQEVMAWSGFALLYDVQPGFTEDNRIKAERLREAFRICRCSFEVKAMADDAAVSYLD